MPENGMLGLNIYVASVWMWNFKFGGQNQLDFGSKAKINTFRGKTTSL